jgi:glycosyltransferase involved in cell wall biosynthesis
MKISVIIPGRNCQNTLYPLSDALKAQNRLSDEILFIDDASSDGTATVAKHLGFRVSEQSVRRGPGAARNLGVELAEGEGLCFIDSDCCPAADWSEKIEIFLTENPDEVVMGKTQIPKAGFLADAISDLGFPGGANLGFEKVWKIDKSGYTDHISACNFGARKAVFERFGGFDERLSLNGCEDVELSLRWTTNGIRIRYRPEVKVWHAPRENLSQFLRWHFSRGRSNYQFLKAFGSVGHFVHLRFWYLQNLIRTFNKDIRLPILILLLGLSVLAQSGGYIKERFRE